MSVAVRVQAKVTGQRLGFGGLHELELQLAPGLVDARQLIEAAVTSEVAAYEARADEATFLRVLTERGLVESLAGGAVRMGEVDRAASVDVVAAVQTALQAFEDGIFKVFVGEEELELAVPVELRDGAELLFLRLVPLAGG